MATIAPWGGRPWASRSTVVTSTTTRVATHTGRRPWRRPRARPTRARPATTASVTDRGWIPNSSQWSKGRVPRTPHSRAKTTLSTPVTQQDGRRHPPDPTPVHPPDEHRLVERPGRTVRQGGHPGGRGQVGAVAGPGRVARGRPGSGGGPRGATGPPRAPGRRPAPRRRTGRRRRRDGAGGTATGGPRTDAVPLPGVGVEALAHHRELGFVGVAGDHPGEPLGHQPGGVGPGRGVVGGRVGPGAHRRLAQGPVDPEQGGHGGHRGHGGHEDHQEPEARQPADRVVVEQSAHPGEEGQQAQQDDGHERDGHQPQLADDLAVEEAGPDEVGDVAVEPLDALEQRPGALP